MRKELVSVSKFLSLVLRHQPETIGIELDEQGWVAVEVLLAACARSGKALTCGELDEVVRTNDKRRFSFSPDGLRIRANQGHSIPVELGLTPTEPPELVYHGTVERFVAPIRQAGLLRGSRQHVHLSPDVPTASRVGQRRGRPVVLVVEAGQMFRDGYQFYLSDNGVWLTDSVPVMYLRFPK